MTRAPVYAPRAVSERPPRILLVDDELPIQTLLSFPLQRDGYEVVTVADGRATKVAGDPDHPLTRGGLCVKVNNYQDKVYSPDRLLYPMRRSGPKGSGEFTRISWDDALDEIAGLDAVAEAPAMIRIEPA